MKQIWQAEDGSLFDTEQEAQDWEDSAALKDELAQHIYGNTCGLRAADINEMLEFILAHYNVTPK